MATTAVPIRTAAMRRLADLIEQTNGDLEVQVMLGGPATETAQDQILVLSADGDLRIAAMSASVRKPRDDTFEISVFIITRRPGATALEAGERFEELWGTVDETLATYTTLDGLDGCVHAIARQLTGPTLIPTAEGHDAVGEARIEIKTRLN